MPRRSDMFGSPNWEGWGGPPWPAGPPMYSCEGWRHSLATGNYSLGISRNSRFPPTSFLIRWSFSLFSPRVSWMALSLVLMRPVGWDPREKNLSGPFAWLVQAGAIWVHLIFDTSLPGVPHPYLMRCSPGSLVVFGRVPLGGPRVTWIQVLGGFREKAH